MKNLDDLCPDDITPEMCEDFIKTSMSFTKDEYTEYEFACLFEKVDINNDKKLSCTELKFFLKKTEWFLDSSRIKKQMARLERK